MEKFTAIYVDSWMSGSHMHYLTKFKRIRQKDGETPLDMLKREDLEFSVQYLFHGWPLMQGEITEEMVEK